MHRLRTLHLFAGAGGGILADLLLGHQPVCAVEINEYCQQVLSARQKDGCLPWFPIFADVTEFDGRPWRGLVDVVSGGFPCQDISAAGKGAGIDGERSGMWRHMARIIDEVRPRYAFVENSPRLVRNGLARVLGELTEMGYDAKWCCLPASAVGAPHKRDRIWLRATDASVERCDERRDHWQSGQLLHDQHGHAAQSQPQRQGRISGAWAICSDVADAAQQRCGEAREFRRDEPEEWASGGGKAVADTASVRLERHWGVGDTQRRSLADGSTELRNGTQPGLFADWWATESDLG